jgi:plastocyanin
VLALASCATTAATVELRIATDTGAAMRFVPDSLTVAPNTGATIRFENVGTTPHNLTFEDGSAASDTIVEPGTFHLVRIHGRAAGEYPFVCTIHPEMRGRLIVS